MKTEVTVANRTYIVEYESHGEGLKICIDDQAYTVDTNNFTDVFYSILIAGKSYDIVAAGKDDIYSVAVGGESFNVHFFDPRACLNREKHSQSALESHQLISAPMAGRIIRFKAQVGDLVTSNDGLVILEAMKMENEIKSRGIGVVKEIFAAEDDVVEPGQKLMIIE